MDEESSSHPDEEVASVLASSPAPQVTHTEQRSSTVLTNLSRGNTALLTPSLCGQDSPHQLAGQGELEALKQHLDGCHPDLLDPSGFTPLFWAAAHNQLPTLQHLVQTGANPRHRGNHGETALAIAASRGNKSIIRFLLEECSCDVNSVDDSKNSPLLYAVAENHLACVKILLKSGANVSHRNTNNLSAFDISLSHKHSEIQREIEKYMLSLLHGNVTNK